MKYLILISSLVFCEMGAITPKIEEKRKSNGYHFFDSMGGSIFLFPFSIEGHFLKFSLTYKYWGIGSILWRRKEIYSVKNNKEYMFTDDWGNKFYNIIHTYIVEEVAPVYFYFIPYAKVRANNNYFNFFICLYCGIQLFGEARVYYEYSNGEWYYNFSTRSWGIRIITKKFYTHDVRVKYKDFGIEFSWFVFALRFGFFLATLGRYKIYGTLATKDFEEDIYLYYTKEFLNKSFYISMSCNFGWWGWH